MEKKKVIVCTTLFAVVLISVIVGSLFIKNEDGTLVLFNLIAWFITGRWIADCIQKFYKWLIK